MFEVHEIHVPLSFLIKLFLSSLFKQKQKKPIFIHVSTIDLHAKHVGLADIFQVSTPSSKTVN